MMAYGVRLIRRVIIKTSYGMAMHWTVLSSACYSVGLKSVDSPFGAAASKVLRFFLNM